MRNLQTVQVRTSSGFEKICPFPIGYIYMSTNGTSPASTYGGTWSPLTDSRFLLPSGSWDSQGGTTAVSLKKENLPNHSHYLYGWPNNGSYDGNGVFPIQDSSWGSIGYNNRMAQRYELNQAPNLSGSAFNVLNPYRTCYCWYRTA